MSWHSEKYFFLENFIYFFRPLKILFLDATYRNFWILELRDYGGWHISPAYVTEFSRPYTNFLVKQEFDEMGGGHFHPHYHFFYVMAISLLFIVPIFIPHGFVFGGEGFSADEQLSGTGLGIGGRSREFSGAVNFQWVTGTDLEDEHYGGEQPAEAEPTEFELFDRADHPNRLAEAAYDKENVGDPFLDFEHTFVLLAMPFKGQEIRLLSKADEYLRAIWKYNLIGTKKRRMHSLAPDEAQEAGVYQYDPFYYNFYPLDELGFGVLNYTHADYISTYDPFFIPFVEDVDMAEFQYMREFVEIVVAIDDLWEHEDYLDDDYMLDLAHEVTMNNVILQTKPHETPIMELWMDQSEIFDEGVFTQDNDDPENEAAMIYSYYLEPYEEISDNSLHEGDYYSNVISGFETIAYAGVELSHGYDIGTYGHFDLTSSVYQYVPSLQELERKTVLYGLEKGVISFSSVIGLGPTTSLWNNVYPFEAYTDSVNKVYLRKSLATLYPAMEVELSSDYLQANEDSYEQAETAAYQISALLVALRKIHLGAYPKAEAVRWNPDYAVFEVFNYSQITWVPVVNAGKALQFTFHASLGDQPRLFTPLRGVVGLYARLSDALSSYFLSFSVRVVAWTEASTFRRKTTELFMRPVSLIMHYAKFVFSHFYPLQGSSLEESNILTTLFWWPVLVADKWVFGHNEYGVIVTEGPANIRLYEDLPFYPYWARLGFLDAGEFITKQEFYDPRMFNFYAYLATVEVDLFPPAFPTIAEEFMVTWYFSDSVDEIKKATRRYMSGESWAGEGYTPGVYHLRTDSLRHLPDIPQLKEFNLERQRGPLYRNLRHIFQIVFSDFHGSDIFRYIYHYSVHKLLEDQVFPQDYIVEQDPMVKPRLYEKNERRRRRIAAHAKVRWMYATRSKKLLGRLEAPYLNYRWAYYYMLYKYMFIPPKYKPRRIERRPPFMRSLPRREKRKRRRQTYLR